MTKKTSLPKLSTVIHIPNIEFKNFVKEKYKLDLYDEYWGHICDHHMFKGNDSSMKFYCQFAEEVFPEAVQKDLVKFIPENIMKVFHDDGSEDSYKHILPTIRSISDKDWINFHKSLVKNKAKILKILGEKNEYYYGYLILGSIEALVIQLYDIQDYDSLENKYYWHFSW